MSAVGSDAAFMLERALEEMDDIFKKEEYPALLHKTKPKADDDSAITSKIRDLIEEFEQILVETNYPSGFERKQAGDLYQHASTLSYFMLFMEDVVNHLVRKWLLFLRTTQLYLPQSFQSSHTRSGLALVSLYGWILLFC